MPKYTRPPSTEAAEVMHPQVHFAMGKALDVACNFYKTPSFQYLERVPDVQRYHELLVEGNFDAEVLDEIQRDLVYLDAYKDDNMIQVVIDVLIVFYSATIIKNKNIPAGEAMLLEAGLDIYGVFPVLDAEGIVEMINSFNRRIVYEFSDE